MISQRERPGAWRLFIEIVLRKIPGIKQLDRKSKLTAETGDIAVPILC